MTKKSFQRSCPSPSTKFRKVYNASKTQNYQEEIQARLWVRERKVKGRTLPRRKVAQRECQWTRAA